MEKEVVKASAAVGEPPVGILLPSKHAAALGFEYTLTVNDEHKKGLGQFFTPSGLSSYLASLATFGGVEVHLLDPGFGVGTLACALIERLVQLSPNLTTIYLDAYEIDAGVIAYSEDSLAYLDQWLAERNIALVSRLFSQDFIIAFQAELAFALQPITPCYDIVISNPPYFKIGADDSRNILLGQRHLAQPNIYALFVVLATLLTRQGGQLLFLIPRSFCSGLYFEQFRAFLYRHLRFEQFHLFHSREQAFEHNVLQENIIFKAIRIDEAGQVNYPLLVTSSVGTHDINAASQLPCTLSQVVDLISREKVLFLPTTSSELALIKTFKTWRERLGNFGIKVSTGPVVAFRSLDYLQVKASKGSVPLFWIDHVRHGIIKWPNKRNRQQHVLPVDGKPTTLLPIRNYVLLRRFSTKDDKHRLIAAPFFSAKWDKYEQIGIENKINYIYAEKGELTDIFTAGLSALLNSNLYNDFFRIFSGNTQVSATEVRSLPMPSITEIASIGRQVIKNPKAVNNIVKSILKH